MTEFEWLIVPLLMGILLVLLLWGLRRESVEGQRAAELEIRSDDPPSAYVDGDEDDEQQAELEWLSPGLLEDRRFVAGYLRENTPDLVATLWRNIDSLRPSTTSYQQLFLDLDEGLPEVLRTLENNFFEGALERGIPERSCFVAAYAFLYHPIRRADILVHFLFNHGRFEHRFYLLDGDGKLSRVLVRQDDQAVNELFGRDTLEYRRALNMARNGEADTQFGELTDEIIRIGRLTSGAYGLRAMALAHDGREPQAIRTQLAFALEFDPTNVLARIERARLSGEAGIEAMADQIREVLLNLGDREQYAGFMLAQALTTLGQTATARRLCDLLAVDWPKHPGVQRLRQHLSGNERGAET